MLEIRQIGTVTRSTIAGKCLCWTTVASWPTNGAGGQSDSHQEKIHQKLYCRVYWGQTPQEIPFLGGRKAFRSASLSKLSYQSLED